MSTQPEADLDRYRHEIRSLEDDFAGAMTQLYSVGNHLARVRSSLDRAVASQQTGEGVAPHLAQVAPAPGPTTSPAASPTPPPAPPPAPAVVPVHHGAAPWAAAPHQPVPTPFVPVEQWGPREPWWQREGLVAKVLATVGAAVTLIGVAFLLAMAIQAGYFGPLARVLSGAALALTLVVAAFVVRSRQDTAVGALGLAATGFATAYLDVLAVTRIYDWVPAGAGLVLAGLVAAAGIVVARVWHSQLLATIIVLGVALLAPFVGGERVLLVGAFLLVLTIASYPAQVGRTWPVLEVARVLPTTGYGLAAVVAQGEGHAGTLLVLALALFVLASAVAGLLSSLPPVTAVLVLVATGPAILAGAIEDQWLGFGILAVLALAHVVAAALTPVAEVDVWHRLREISLVVAAAAGVIAVAKVVDGSSVPLAITALAICWVTAAAALRSWSVAAVAAPIAALGGLLSLRMLPLLVVRSEASQTRLRHVVEAAAVVVLIALCGWALARLDRSTPLVGRIVMAVAAVLAPLVLVLAGSLVGRVIATAAGGYLAGHAAATVVWMALAAVLLIRGLGRDGDAGVAVRLGLGLAAVVVAKLLFFDLSALDGIPRVLSFILAGVLLLVMGVGYAQALERSRRLAVDNSAGPQPNPPTVG